MVSGSLLSVQSPIDSSEKRLRDGDDVSVKFCKGSCSGTCTHLDEQAGVEGHALVRHRVDNVTDMMLRDEGIVKFLEGLLGFCIVADLRKEEASQLLFSLHRATELSANAHLDKLYADLGERETPLVQTPRTGHND